jgi:uncharacterized protein with FMN-binding domain
MGVAVGSTTAGFALVLAMHTLNPSTLALSTTGGGRHGTTTTVPQGVTTTTVPHLTTGTHSATGSSVQYGYGAISVKVTEHNGSITDVSVASLQTAESYSQQLANAAIPQLRQEVLSAQSANVATVSGATYTSEGYLQSLSAALHQLGL